MTIIKLRSDPFGPGCHQVATLTAIYASPCRHLPVEVLVVVRTVVIKLLEYPPDRLCMESTSYVLSFRIRVFFYLVTTGWIFDIKLT